MAFTRATTGNTALEALWNQIIDAWEGVAGSANRIQITQVNDSSNYAADVQNLDSTNSYGLRVRDSSSNNILLAALAAVTIAKKLIMTGLGTFTTAANMLDIAATWNGAVTFNGILVTITNTSSAAASRLVKFATSAASVFEVTVGGLAFLNDSANTNMTQGLTIQQGAATNQALAIKNTTAGAQHGITDDSETDTYLEVKMNSATLGGAAINGYAGAISDALVLSGKAGATSAARGTTGGGTVYLNAQLKNGTAAGSIGADKNMVAFGDNDTTRFIFDSDGDSHEDGTGWTAYDDHDDIALLDMCNAVMLRAGDPIKQEFWAWAGENARKLQDLKLITFNVDGHHFINRSKMQELLVGAQRQAGRRIVALEAQNAMLMAEVKAIRQALPPAAQA